VCDWITVEPIGIIDCNSSEDGEGHGAFEFESFDDWVISDLQLNLLKVL
jgi:hypothetical protein